MNERSFSCVIDERIVEAIGHIGVRCHIVGFWYYLGGNPLAHNFKNLNIFLVEKKGIMIPKKWEIQLSRNWWISLGLHVDHTDPSITIHLPGILIYIGNCKQPGFKGGSHFENYKNI